MTLPLLKLIGHELAIKNWEENSKLVVWTAMCTAFFGSFRMGELLSKAEFGFSHFDTLLWADIRFLKDGSIQIRNRIPKNRSQTGEIIDLFPFEGSSCPVNSLKKLWTELPHEKNMPVFRFKSGKFLTQKTFNSVITDCLKPHFKDKAFDYSGHSFRVGLPSALSSCQS